MSSVVEQPRNTPLLLASLSLVVTPWMIQAASTGVPASVSMSAVVIEVRVGRVSTSDPMEVEATISNLSSHRLRNVVVSLLADPDGLSIEPRSDIRLGALRGDAEAEATWVVCPQRQGAYVVLAQVSYRLNHTVHTDQSKAVLLEVDAVDDCPKVRRPAT